MKSWMQERDLLIAQTMAFVEEVAAAAPIRDRPPNISVTPTSVEQETVAAPTDDLLNAEQPIEVELVAAPPQVARLIARSAVDEREEILNRVASFKAHQARFLQDRDEFFRAAMTRITDPAGSQAKGKSM
jgi:hypothetical protein